MCQDHFFRCITCNNYDPGLNECKIHNISIHAEINLCSLHSSNVYKHMDNDVLYKVEDTLLGTDLIKCKKIKSVKKKMHFLCKICRTKIENLKLDEENSFLNEILLFFKESSRNLEEDLYNSKFVENSDYDEYLVEDFEFHCELEKFSLCNNCIPKIKKIEKSETDPLLVRVLTYFKLYLKNEY